MTDFDNASLGALIACTPKLDDKDVALIGSNRGDIAVSNNGGQITITSKTNDRALLRALNRFLRNLGILSSNLVASTPNGQYFLSGDDVPKISLDINLEGVSSAVEHGNAGRGIGPNMAALQHLMDDRDAIRKYYGIIKKLNELAGVDVNDFVSPEAAEIVSRHDKKPFVKVDFMKSWAELQTLAKNPGVPTGELIFAGYTNRPFYESFVNELNETLGDGVAKLRVHASFARHADAVPSVLEIPLGKMMENANSINALLDKYLGKKRLISGQSQDHLLRASSSRG